MEKQIVFTGKQQSALKEYDAPEISEGVLGVRTSYSLMSTGTENIVFNGLYEAGTIFDAWVKYPFYPGYAAVGVVEKVQGNGHHFKVGDLVVHRGKHASYQAVKAEGCFKVPAGLDARSAVWFALAKISFMSAKAANYQLGDRVLVIGAGPIGQMAIRWASVCPVQSLIVCDGMAGRLELARQGGATHVIGKPIEECTELIRDITGNAMPNVVVDSTGNAAVFESALKTVCDRGRVVLVGDTGMPSLQRLTHDVVVRGISIVGAHDCHTDNGWTAQRINSLFFDLVMQGRINLDNLNTHFFAPAKYQDAYQLANTRRGETMGVLFDWNTN
jgi:2-desacetyl-2-hydroxyethyl bacteriochlorophyllide A dehydrogenase